MKEEVKLYKRKGGWSKIVQFLDNEGYHKFYAQAIQLGDPSFILKHITITGDDNKTVHCFPVVIRDIDKVDINSVREIYNDKSGNLAPNLLNYINRRKKVLEKQVPILTTEEIDYAVKSKNNRYTVELETLDYDDKLRASLATVEIYNKSYFLFVIQKKVGNKYTVQDPANLLKNYKLVDVRVGIMNVFLNLFRIRNGIILSKPRTFYAVRNNIMADIVDTLIHMAIADINNNKLKPSVKLRKISDYGFKVPFIIIG